MGRWTFQYRLFWSFLAGSSDAQKGMKTRLQWKVLMVQWYKYRKEMRPSKGPHLKALTITKNQPRISTKNHDPPPVTISECGYCQLPRPSQNRAGNLRAVMQCDEPLRSVLIFGYLFIPWCHGTQLAMVGRLMVPAIFIIAVWGGQVMVADLAAVVVVVNHGIGGSATVIIGLGLGLPRKFIWKLPVHSWRSAHETRILFSNHLFRWENPLVLVPLSALP